MKTLKMSLESIQGKMSRKEMRNIMAGSGDCTFGISGTNWYNGQCYIDVTHRDCSSECHVPYPASYCGH